MNESFDLSQVERQESIGEGGFGKVFKVKDKKTSEIYAAKVSLREIDKADQEEMLNLYREVTIISKIHHPAVLGFIGYSPVDFHKNPKPVIVTEYSSNGSLAHLIKLASKGLALDGYDDTKKLIILYGIAAGMAYLHSKKILHRDLKAGNILVDDCLCPKIADFGLSKVYHNETTVVTPDSTIDVKGTPMFIAPEIWKDQDYTEQGDVYAYAFIIYEMIHSPIPPEKLTPYQIMERVLKKKFRPKIEIPIPKCYKKLIEECWHQNPKKRPTFANICQRLKTDKDFITDGVIKEDFDDYCIFLEEAETTYDKTKRIINLSDMIDTKKKTFFKVVIPQPQIGKKQKQKSIFPDFLSVNLSKECKQLVEEAENDDDKQLTVGMNLIEGKNGFSQNTELGIKYLKTSAKKDNIEAAKYLSKLLLDGDIVPQDPEMVIKYLKNFLTEKDATVFTLYGKACKLNNDLSNAVKNFQDGAKRGNAEAMFEYGVCLFNGEGIEKDIEQGKKYFSMAKKNGYKIPAKYDTEKKPKPIRNEGSNSNDSKNANKNKGQQKHQPNKNERNNSVDSNERNKNKGPKKYTQNKISHNSSDDDDDDYDDNDNDDDDRNKYKKQRKYQQNKNAHNNTGDNYNKDKNKVPKKYPPPRRTHSDDDDDRNKKKVQRKIQPQPKNSDTSSDDDDSNSSQKQSGQSGQSEAQKIWKETEAIIKRGTYQDENGKQYNIDNNMIASAQNTVTYKPDSTFDMGNFFSKRKSYGRSEKASIYSKIEVTTESTFAAAKRFKSNNIKEVCCLSFASAFIPGSGTRCNSRNQEAILSRRSSLLLSLVKHDEMYKYNLQQLKHHYNPYFSDYMIYAPNVVVFRDDDDKLIPPFRVSVISSAAVNYAKILNDHPNGEKFQEAYKCMKDRCRKIIELCITTNNKVLILGAFGCGSFKNDPEAVSQIFKELLVDEFYGMLLKNIVFAIKAPPNNKNDAYEAFKARFSPRKDSKS